MSSTNVNPRACACRTLHFTVRLRRLKNAGERRWTIHRLSPTWFCPTPGGPGRGYSIGSPSTSSSRMTPLSSTKKTRVPVTADVSGLAVSVYWLALTCSNAYVYPWFVPAGHQAGGDGGGG